MLIVYKWLFLFDLTLLSSIFAQYFVKQWALEPTTEKKLETLVKPDNTFVDFVKNADHIMNGQTNFVPHKIYWRIILIVLYWICLLQRFPLPTPIFICGLSSLSLIIIFPRAEVFNCIEVQFINYFSQDCSFNVI